MANSHLDLFKVKVRRLGFVFLRALLKPMPLELITTRLSERKPHREKRLVGVPFYLRSGKRLPRRVTKIIVHFKSPPLSFFEGTHCDLPGPNLLIMHI